jgi:hypothetical protein
MYVFFYIRNIYGILQVFMLSVYINTYFRFVCLFFCVTAHVKNLYISNFHLSPPVKSCGQGGGADTLFTTHLWWIWFGSFVILFIKLISIERCADKWNSVSKSYSLMCRFTTVSLKWMPVFIYEVVSKLFQTDTVKIIKLSIRFIGHHHPRNNYLPHVDTGPTVSSIFWRLPGSPFLSEWQPLWD